MNRGYTLVEMIIYVALLAVLVGVVISALLTVIASYQRVEAAVSVQQAATVITDRIVREVQLADDVNVGGSSFNVSAGVLSLSAGSVVKEIALESGVVNLDEDGSLVGPLSSSGVTADSLVFRYMDGDNSELVSIELTLTARDYTEVFYNSAIVRQQY